MCMSCWAERGSPEIINKSTVKAAQLIEGVYDHHGAGGSLHIVLDDWNLSDASLDYCETEISRNEGRVESRRTHAERKCLEALKKLTEPERASALAIYEGYTNQ